MCVISEVLLSCSPAAVQGLQGGPTVHQGRVGMEATGMSDTQSWASQPKGLNGETGHCSKEEADRQWFYQWDYRFSRQCEW